MRANRALMNKNNKGRINNMNKNKLSRFLLSASAGMFSTVGVSEIKALTAEETAVLNAAIEEQVSFRTAQRAQAAAHFQGQGVSAEDATRMANDLMSDSSAFRALSSLGAEQSKLLYNHFSNVLRGGIALTPEHFDDFAAVFADQDTLEALGVSDVRELESPAVERLVAPDQITSLDEAVYFANQRKVAGEFKAAAEFYEKARGFSTVAADKQMHAESALLMYSEHFIHNVSRVNDLTEATIVEARALFEGAVSSLANETNTMLAYQRAAMCAKELATATYDLAVFKEVVVKATTDAAQLAILRTEAAGLYKKLYAADMAASAMYDKAIAITVGSDKNAMMVKAADERRLAIGALADAVNYSNMIVAAGGTALIFDGDVTMKAKLEMEAKAFVDEYADVVDGSVTDHKSQLQANATRATIEEMKLKATWNARRRQDATSTAYAELTAQYDALKTGITTILGSAAIQYGNLQTEYKHLGALYLAEIRRANVEALYRDALSAIDANTVAAQIADLKAYVDGDQAAVVSEMDTLLAAAVNADRAMEIREVRSAVRRVLATTQARVARTYAAEITARAGTTVADDNTNMEVFLDYAQKSNSRKGWEAGIAAADKVLTAYAAPGAEDEILAKVLAGAAKAEGLLSRNTPADDTVVATVDAATSALTAGVLFDARAAATSLASQVDARAERAYKALSKAFERGAELHNQVTVKQGIREAWSVIENLYATASFTLADAANTAPIQLGDGTLIAELYAQAGAAADADAFRDAFDDGVGGGWLNVAGAAAVGEAGTLAQYLASLVAAPTTVVDAATGATYATATVDQIFNHLNSKFNDLRKARTDVYMRYDTAAAAWEKARKAKAEWAVAKIDGLKNVVTSVNWAAERDAAGAAYTAAAAYEASRVGAMIAARGMGLFAANVDTLADILANVTANKATQYADEDVMKAVYHMGMQHKMAAKTYNMTRDAVGTEAAVVASATATTSVQSAIEDSAGLGAHTGAYELSVALANQALQGLATVNNVDAVKQFAVDRLSSVVDAFRHVNGRWLSDMSSTIGMLDAADQLVMKDTLHALMQNNGAAVAATAHLAGRMYAFDSALMDDFNPGVGPGNLVATQSYHRLAGRLYETILRTVSTLGATATIPAANLDVNKGHMFTVLKKHADRAVDVARTAYLPGAILDVAQRDALIAAVQEYADIAAAAGSMAYAGTMFVNASETGDTYKTARSRAIDAAVNHILVQAAKDSANLVTSNTNNNVVLADHKAAMWHQLGRVLTNAGKALDMRNKNRESDQHRAEALKSYEDAVAAYNAEISTILSETTGTLPNHNARLIEAYENLAEAYKYAVALGTKNKDWSRMQYMALFHQAQYMYRSGDVDGSFRQLDELSNNVAARGLVGGHLLAEIAAQYEGEGQFVKAAAVYRDAAEVHVSKGEAEVELAFKSAGSAMSDAVLTGEPRAAQYAAEAYKEIGKKSSFNGRVRAEAYHKAADAYIMSQDWVESAKSYEQSASLWMGIGDHMQAGNMYEKAAWAMTKIAAASITIDNRITMLGYLAKASKQLQVAGAIKRIAKLATLADAQYAAATGDRTKVSGAQLASAVVEFATTLAEEAMAFQREGDVAKATAAEDRIQKLLEEVNAKAEEAAIHTKVGDLRVLQSKHAEAIDSYTKSAENYVSAGMHMKALTAYRMAADAALKGAQGRRILDSILPEVLKISGERKEAAAADATKAPEALSAQMEVLSVYVDMLPLLPDMVNDAMSVMADVESALATSTDKLAKAKFAGMKVSILERKARREADDVKMQRLASAKLAFESVKDIVGDTDLENAELKASVTHAAAKLADMYRTTKAFTGETALVKIAEFQSVVDSVAAASNAAYAAAEKAKSGFDYALTATRNAAEVQKMMARTMMHYMHTQTANARVEDLVYFKSLPHKLVEVAEVAIKAYLRGLLKTREAAAVMKDQFVDIMNAANKVNNWVLNFRKAPESRDQHGDAAKAAAPKAKVANAAADLQVATVASDAKVADAHKIVNPAERAKATAAVVDEKANATAAAVKAALKASADIATSAPVNAVSQADLGASETAMKHILGESGKEGVAAQIRKDAAGPSAPAVNAVQVNVRD